MRGETEAVRAVDIFTYILHQTKAKCLFLSPDSRICSRRSTSSSRAEGVRATGAGTRSEAATTGGWQQDNLEESQKCTDYEAAEKVS